MAFVTGNAIARTGFPANGQLQHDRVLAMGYLYRGYQIAFTADNSSL
jgi:hypothetical protein